VKKANSIIELDIVDEKLSEKEKESLKIKKR
jgi:hypothetical protein